MIFDAIGSEFRGGKILKAKDWMFRSTPEWWESQSDLSHYKIVASIVVNKTKIIVWQGNFFDLAKALKFWQSLHEIGPAPYEWDMPTPSWYPGLSTPGVVYEFATVQTFNSTPGGGTFTIPALVFSTDYLVVAGGAAGGSNGGGGGGAGEYLTAISYSVTPGASLTVTVGAGGIAALNTVVNGNNSVFATITSGAGGGGGGGAAGSINANNGVSGSTGAGSGGGGASASSAGTNTGGGGNNGGAGSVSGSGGGGGGAGAVGGAAGTLLAGGIGGAGTSSSISGSSVTYAGGGGGRANSAGGGGAGGGGNGGNSGTSTGGTANTGGGGGGDGNGSAGKNGGSGVVILSYTAGATVAGNMPMIGM